MKSPSFDLFYTITIKGRIDLKDKTAQDHCLMSAPLMANSPPAGITRTSTTIQLSDATDNIDFKLDKRGLNAERHDHILGL